MDEQGQPQIVVLTVVVLLGAVALVGLCGTIWLIHDYVDASAVAVVATITGAAAGSLGTLLASTRATPTPTVQAAQAQGYRQAVEDVQQLPPAVQPVQVVNDDTEPVPVEPAGPPTAAGGGTVQLSDPAVPATSTRSVQTPAKKP